jgi:hypothetical protein
MSAGHWTAAPPSAGVPAAASSTAGAPSARPRSVAPPAEPERQPHCRLRSGRVAAPLAGDRAPPWPVARPVVAPPDVVPAGSSSAASSQPAGQGRGRDRLRLDGRRRVSRYCSGGSSRGRRGAVCRRWRRTRARCGRRSGRRNRTRRRGAAEHDDSAIRRLGQEGRIPVRDHPQPGRRVGESCRSDAGGDLGAQLDQCRGDVRVAGGEIVPANLLGGRCGVQREQRAQAADHQPDQQHDERSASRLAAPGASSGASSGAHADSRIRCAARNRAEEERGLAASSAAVGSSAPWVSSRSCGP